MPYSIGPVAAADKTARLWNASTGVALGVLKGHRHGLNDCAWAPSGDLLATASDDCTVRLWDTTTVRTTCLVTVAFPIPKFDTVSQYA